MNCKFWSIAAHLSYFTCVFLWAKTHNLWGRSYFTCVFNVIRLFYQYKNCSPCDLDLRVLSALEYLTLAATLKQLDQAFHMFPVYSSWKFIFPSVQRFLASRDECPGSLCHSPGVRVGVRFGVGVCAWTKTLTLAITFLLEVIELSYCTWVFLVTRPFTLYHNFWPRDLDLEVWPTFEKL